MSETEETHTIPEPTLAQQVDALRREVEHVTEQMRVEHGMMLDWRDRALTAERRLDNAQRGSGSTPGKTGPKSKARVSDGLHGQPEMLDTRA